PPGYLAVAHHGLPLDAGRCVAESGHLRRTGSLPRAREPTIAALGRRLLRTDVVRVRARVPLHSRFPGPGLPFLPPKQTRFMETFCRGGSTPWSPRAADRAHGRREPVQAGLDRDPSLEHAPPTGRAALPARLDTLRQPRRHQPP